MADYLQRLALRGAAGLTAALPPAVLQSDPRAIEQHVESIASHAAPAADAPADRSPAVGLSPVPAAPPRRPREDSRSVRPTRALSSALELPHTVQPPVLVQPDAGSTTRGERVEMSGTAPVAVKPFPNEALAPADHPAPEAAPLAASIPAVPEVTAANATARLQTVTLARPVPAQPTSPDEDTSEPRSAAADGPSVLIGRIDIEVAPPVAPPRPAPVERTRGFARYANSRRGLRD